MHCRRQANRRNTKVLALSGMAYDSPKSSVEEDFVGLFPGISTRRLNYPEIFDGDLNTAALSRRTNKPLAGDDMSLTCISYRWNAVLTRTSGFWAEKVASLQRTINNHYFDALNDILSAECFITSEMLEFQR